MQGLGGWEIGKKHDVLIEKKVDKFIAEIGDLNDFVLHLNSWQENSQKELLNLGGKRYLLLDNKAVPIIDFRHFLSAMFYRLNSYKLGTVLFLGIGLEADQMLKINSSAFSKEDLGSNRMGVDFAEYILKSRAENDNAQIGTLLNRFLKPFNPIKKSAYKRVKHHLLNNFFELSYQVLKIIEDFIIGKSY